MVSGQGISAVPFSPCGRVVVPGVPVARPREASRHCGHTVTQASAPYSYVCMISHLCVTERGYFLSQRALDPHKACAQSGIASITFATFGTSGRFNYTDKFAYFCRVGLFRGYFIFRVLPSCAPSLRQYAHRCLLEYAGHNTELAVHHQRHMLLRLILLCLFVPTCASVDRHCIQLRGPVTLLL